MAIDTKSIIKASNKVRKVEEPVKEEKKKEEPKEKLKKTSTRKVCGDCYYNGCCPLKTTECKFVNSNETEECEC